MGTELAEATQVETVAPAAEPTPEPPAPEEGAAALAGEAAEATEEPAPPSVYASIHDPYDILDHETVKPILQQRLDRLVAERQRDLEADYAARTQEWESTNVSRTISGIAGRLQEAINADNLPGAEKLVAQLEKLTERYDPVTQETLIQKGRAEGNQAGRLQLVDMIRDEAKGMLDERGKDELASVFDKAKEWKEVFTFLRDRWTAPQKAENEKLKLEVERLKAHNRSGEGPNLSAGAPTGGRSDDELLLDPTTPISVIKEIRDRQRGA